VTLVGSHDTASAFVAVPAEGEDAAFISCGTWGLVGVELSAPVLTEASRAENFTNELGVDGTVRYLRNVMGLWLLSETLRTWERAGTHEDLETILGAAAALPGGGPVVDPDDPAFLPPGDMPKRILDACARSGQPLPVTRAATVRCILDSLAAAFARAVAAAATLSGREIAIVHLVGGGARNRLLCQLTADACGRPVAAGPVEATALGNVLVQARTLGLVSGSLADLRELVRATQPVRRFEPRRGAVPVSPR
jgi:rhamnulokinase